MIQGVERMNNMKYAKPPIEEALIDIRLSSAIEGSQEQMNELADLFKSELPLRTSKKAFHLSSDQETIQKADFAGIALKDAKPSHILQLDRDGMTYSIIKNYDTWEQFENAFLKYWREFKKLIDKTTLIRRVGVRFVNKLSVPVRKLDDLQQYSTIKIDVPLENQELKEAFTRLVISPSVDVNCIVTQVLNMQISGQNLILDIDVFTEKNIPLDDEVLRELFSDFREIKNEVFEQSLTAKTKESFQ